MTDNDALLPLRGRTVHRAYLVLGALLVGLFSYGQYNHWSLYGTDAGTKEPSRLAGASGTRGK